MNVLMAVGPLPGVDKALPFLLFSIALGVVTRLAISKSPVQPPFTVMLFVFGMLFAAWANDPGQSLGSLGVSIGDWEGLHPHLILFVFLPPLLFESAFAMDFHIFWRVLGQSLILALPGVMIATGLSACCIQLVCASYNWEWDVALLLGAMLSATDPVAVVAVLHTLGAPHKLSTVIEGESLLNDGSAFVLFLIFVKFVNGESPGAGEIIGTFAQLALGGPAFGLASAFVMYLFIKPVYNDVYVEVSTLLVCVFAVFFVAETVLHVSGVLAVVTFGVFMARSGKYALSREVEHNNHAIWAEIGWLANTIIFVLAGVVIFNRVVVLSDVAADGANWGYLIAMYFLLHIVRASVVAIFWPLLKNMGYGLNWKEATIMVYGGLRGAVGLALALLVDLEPGIDKHTKDLINFHCSGIVVLTLLVNGSTCGLLYNALNIYPPNPYRTELARAAVKEMRKELVHSTAKLKSMWLFKGVTTRWGVVASLVPDFFEDAKWDDKGNFKIGHQSVDEIFIHHMRHQHVAAAFQATAFAASTPATMSRLTESMAIRKEELEAAAIADGATPVTPDPTAAGAPPMTLAATGGGSAESKEEKTSEASPVKSSAPRGFPKAGLGQSIRNIAGSKGGSMNSARGRLNTYTMLFNAMRAHYTSSYDKRVVSDSSLMILIETADLAEEEAKKLETVDDGSTLEVVKPAGMKDPFEVGADVLTKHMQMTWFEGKAYESSILSENMKRGILFEHVETSIEALAAFILSHEDVMEHASAFGFGIPEELEAAIKRAKKLMMDLQRSHQLVVTVMKTILPAIILVEEQLRLVGELSEHKGLLDHQTAHDLQHALEHRMTDLHAYVPSVSLMNELQRAQHNEASRRDVTSPVSGDKKSATVAPVPEGAEESEPAADVEAGGQ